MASHRRKQELVTRRNLPHWYVPGAAHFVTYRLAGSLPRTVVEELQHRRKLLLSRLSRGESRCIERLRIHKQLFSAYDEYLDQHRDREWLADPRVGKIVRDNLGHHDGRLYQLLAYCIMPNHVHLLILPAGSPMVPDEEFAVGEVADHASPLSRIMHSLKSYTATHANRVLARTGPFWQRESYDHWVRDEEELERIVLYIRGNPVKAGLVREPQDWKFSSCGERFKRDGDVTGWLPEGPSPIVF